MIFILIALGLVAVVPMIGEGGDEDVSSFATDPQAEEDFGETAQTYQAYSTTGAAEAWEGELKRPEVDQILQAAQKQLGGEIKSYDDYVQRLEATADRLVNVEFKNGTEGADNLMGTNQPDLILGQAGNDTINLGGGDDEHFALFVREELGDDLVRGGSGNDDIADQSGSNTLLGGTGNDTLTTLDDPTHEGADVVNGGFGNDTILADNADTVTGGEGDDVFATYLRSGLSSSDVVEITDFQPGQDKLDVMVETDTPKSQDDYTLTKVAAQGGTLLQVDGADIALLRGIDPSQLDTSQIQVWNARFGD
jgi:Ca2+-binding RTX toxin-like protein